jgi:hypothetical protein
MGGTRTRWLPQLRPGRLFVSGGRLRRSPCAGAALLAGGLLIGVVPVGGPGPASASSRASVQPLRWTVVPSANQGFDRLGALSCLLATDCFAAGSRVGGDAFTKALIESWNGHRFAIVPSPSPSSTNSALGGISCVSATFCVAVGSADNKRDFTRTLIESWNGTAWSVVPSPSPGGLTFIDVLGDVSCVSAAFCMAVGSYGPGELTSSLIESWNGRVWSVMPSPSRGPHSDAVLNAVDCLSATDCMGAGSYLTPAGQRRTLAARWSGTQWTVLPTPNQGPINNVNDVNSLGGAFCLSANACTAVGSWSTAQGVTRTLIQTWNGTKWSVEPSPDRGSMSTPNALGGIACVSASDCTATGASGSGPGGSTRTLIESWDGTRWSIAPSPNQGPTSDFNRLGGISCPSPRLCITVGGYANINAQGHTLAEIGTRT